MFLLTTANEITKLGLLIFSIGEYASRLKFFEVK